MKAVRFHGVGDLRVEEVPKPGGLAAGTVRLAVRAAGICGSDLHNFRTGMWMSRLPVTPGHEFAAEVTELGPGVDRLALGDLVVADSRATCGECPNCVAGRRNLCDRIGYVGEVCDGGFAEEVVLPANRVIKVPPGVAPEIAALSEPLAVALRVVRRLDPKPGQPILIAGGGAIGGLAALLLSEFGFGPVSLAERNTARASLLARIAGVEIVTLDQARDYPLAIEATGSASVLRVLIDSVSAGGRIVMVGIFDGEAVIPVNRLVEGEIELIGSAVFQGEQQEAVDLLPHLAARLQALIGPVIALDAVPAAYGKLIAGGEAALKTILRP
jgi:(R,R)-butanediol dehydrogenase/meso-butanediol dehydrogenase/diacetyl reductase